MIRNAETLAMSHEPAPARKFVRFSLTRDQEFSPAKARHQFFWARNGLYFALRALGLPSGSHVLLPSYLCSAAIEPFLEVGARVEFYEVGHDAYPDFADLEARIRPSTGAILAVHYFGFPAPIRHFQDICDRHDIRLIEDCAHVLVGEVEGQSLGSFGDASIFSWRKFLPLFDGADLLLNRRFVAPDIPWNKERMLLTAKIAKCLIDRILERSASSNAKALSHALEFSKSLWKRSRPVGQDTPLVSLDSNALSLDRSLLNQPISRVSKWLLDHSDIPAVVGRRRQNFLGVGERLRHIEGVRPLFDELPVSICPWVYPVIFDGIENAHLALRERGIPAVTWGGVRSALIDRKQYANASFLYENLVFLPIHQDLETSDLDLIAKAVREVAAISAIQTPSVSQQPVRANKCA